MTGFVIGKMSAPTIKNRADEMRRTTAIAELPIDGFDSIVVGPEKDEI